jgi:hydrogenase expression/formation protein HypC
MCLAIPARVVEFYPDEPNLALVEVVGVRRHIDISLLQDDPLQTGDWVLVHVGFAMSRINEADALDQLRILALLGEETAVVEEFEGYGATDSHGPGMGPPS